MTRKVAADGNVSFMRLVDDVTEHVITQSELAVAVGTSERTVQNWVGGQTKPAGSAQQRLLDVWYLVGQLRDVYTDEGIQIWLKTRNRNLGSARPLALLAEGRVDEVLEEVDRVVGGM